MSTRRRAGFSLVEVLVALVLGMIAVATLGAATAVGTRALARTAIRTEAEDIVQLAIEAFAFDVRRAGFDPSGTGIEALPQAAGDHLIVQADLDQDGGVDGASEETTTWICNAGAHKLSRVIGSQSLPIANDVTTCSFAYLDAAGLPLAAGAAGLDAAARAAIRLVVLDVAIRPPGASATSARRVSIALRGAP